MVPHRELTVDIVRIRVCLSVCLSILNTDQKKRSSVGRLLGYSHLYHPYGLIDCQELKLMTGNRTGVILFIAGWDDSLWRNRHTQTSVIMSTS